MSEQIPDCPEFMEFMKWFEEKAQPEYDKFYTHLATCSQCQQILMEIKGQIELKLIQTSDAELLQVLKSFNPR